MAAKKKLSIALYGDSVFRHVKCPSVENLYVPGLLAQNAQLPTQYTNVVVCVGGNDIATSRTAEAIHKDLNELQVAGKKTGVSVRLMLIPPRGDVEEDEKRKEKMEQVNTLLEADGASSAFHDALLGPGLRGYHQIHPTPAGTDQLCIALEAICKEIRTEAGVADPVWKPARKQRSQQWAAHNQHGNKKRRWEREQEGWNQGRYRDSYDNNYDNNYH